MVSTDGQQDFDGRPTERHVADYATAFREAQALLASGQRMFLRDIDRGDWSELSLSKDAGVPGSAAKIVRAIESLGRTPADIRHIIVTHCHPDHAGSLAAIKRLTTAPV
jgi:ribonuclease BN (tRNA processing enzyme)